MNKVVLDLTVEEINALLAALGRMPYADVFMLVDKIRTEAQTQLAPKAEEQPAE